MCKQCTPSRRGFLRLAGGTLALTMLAACGRQAGQEAGESTGEEEVHWEYAGEAGPEHWGTLTPAFSPCSTGTRQSPIDITNVAVSDTSGDLVFHYGTTPLQMINNGHTIQINTSPGNTITLEGEQYELVQFHFHNPSEHAINGQRAAMELHLVHKNQAGNLAVVGVLMQPGASHPLLSSFWQSLPAEGQSREIDAYIPLMNLLPAERGYYTYSGSLTTPPCSEGVRWIVMKQPIQLTQAQIDHYGSMLGGTARPLQERNNRGISEF